MPHSSNGQDTGLSSPEPGFDSLMRYLLDTDELVSKGCSGETYNLAGGVTRKTPGFVPSAADLGVKVRSAKGEPTH